MICIEYSMNENLWKSQAFNKSICICTRALTLACNYCEENNHLCFQHNLLSPKDKWRYVLNLMVYSSFHTICIN